MEHIAITTRFMGPTNTSPNRNARFAWKWIYDAIGPDGRRFDNDSIVALRGVLRRAYGRDTKLVESWKAESND